MSFDVSKKRVFFLANPDKAEAVSALEKLTQFAKGRCEIVGSTIGSEGHLAKDAGAERLVVIGGDGTLIGAARSLDGSPIPIVSVSIGKLGFLAEYTVDEFQTGFERAMGDDSLVSRRTMLQSIIKHKDQVRQKVSAINDCVIRAGEPFRIIRLGISINGEPLTEMEGDGLIVCTPSGSTAHNLSAGGPLMQAGVDAIVLTPLAPHSLTLKPLVIEREEVIEILACRINPGTTVIIDGQVSCPFNQGDCLTIRRYEHDFLLVRNPAHSKWHNLVTKLHWGRSPQYD